MTKDKSSGRTDFQYGLIQDLDNPIKDQVSLCFPVVTLLLTPFSEQCPHRGQESGQQNQALSKS